MYLYTTFQPLNYTKLLVIIIRPKAEENFQRRHGVSGRFIKVNNRFYFWNVYLTLHINTTLTIHIHIQCCLCRFDIKFEASATLLSLI